eukprot:TRINITY_DN23817_c0_g1_i1.p1 TRINITY_DN23817_c0_g1~~TRINITY_DN23817_c0_g1_i1.p1  ORF type:complete len:544 (-),score=104.15 TRINITY_DN23817_c0_g1_i1:407-1987(-)
MSEQLQTPNKKQKGYWLVANVQVLQVDVVNESVRLKIFAKWFFEMPDFLDQVRDKTICLSLKDADDNFEIRLKELEEGEMCHGVEIKDTGSILPFNPDRIIENTLEKEEDVVKPWIQFKSPLVAVQRVVITTILAPMNIRRFPYDRHVIPIKLVVRSNKILEWKLSKHILETMEKTFKTFGEEEFVVNVMPVGQLGNLVWDQKPKAYFDTRPILYLRVQRDPKYFLLTIVLPIFIVVLVAMSSFSFRGDGDNLPRFNATLTSMLTVVAYKLTLQQGILPQKPYLTMLDWYLLGVFFFHLACTVKILVVVQLYGKNGVFSPSGNATRTAVARNASTNVSNMNSTEAAHAQANYSETSVMDLSDPTMFIDFVTSVCLIGMWILVHLAISVDFLSRKLIFQRGWDCLFAEARKRDSQSAKRLICGDMPDIGDDALIHEQKDQQRIDIVRKQDETHLPTILGNTACDEHIPQRSEGKREVEIMLTHDPTANSDGETIICVKDEEESEDDIQDVEPTMSLLREKRATWPGA